MKKTKCFFITIVLYSLFINFSIPNVKIMATENNIPSPPTVLADSAVLIDAKTGLVLFDKNMNKKQYPASITKVMTSLLACEYGKFDEVVTHSHEAVFGIERGSSHIGMVEGEQITLEQALYGMLLPSANEVCIAVSEKLDGTLEDFVKHMNKKAKEIGAVNSNFMNPNGLPNENHYVTAYDMALIMKAAIQYDEFKKVIATATYQIPPTNKQTETRYLSNSNKLIQKWSPNYYEYCVGGKTGFTDAAQHTLVAYGKKGDIELISVVLKDTKEGPYVDTKNLLEYGFGLMTETNIFNSKNYASSTDVIQKFENDTIDLGKLDLVADHDVYSVLPRTADLSKIVTSVNLPKNIISPVEKNQKIGTINFSYDGTTLGSADILAKDSVPGIDENILTAKKNKEKLKKNLILAGKVVGTLIVFSFACGVTIRLRNSKVKKRKRVSFKYR